MIFEKVLPNGLEIIVRPTDVPVVAIQAWVDVGSIDERPAEAGYCHFLEHMLFKGTKRRTTAQIAGAIEGAGGDMNAFTSFEYTVYHMTLSNQRWELANEILADMLLGSTFVPAEFDSEKKVILEEIRRGEDSPDRQLYQGIYSMLYGTSGYGRPVIGFPATVKRCSAAGLKSFWKRWYSPSLMTVVVSGDVDPAKFEKHAARLWGRGASRAPRLRRRVTGFNQRISGTHAKTSDRAFPVNSVRWIGALPACSIRDANLPALDIATMILGQGESSRLHRKLFRQAASVTSIGAGLWAPAGTGMLNVDAEVPIEKQGAFREQLWHEIDQFVEEGPTSEELERAKSIVESDRVYGSQTMDGLANRLGFLQTVVGNPRFDLDFMAHARELTADDVREAAARYFDRSNFREFALFPKTFDHKKFWEPKGTARIATRKPPSKHQPIERVSLSNGIELVLLPRRDVPIVAIQACALGGLRVEDDASSGMGHLLSDVWEKGPKGWGAEKFAAHLETRGSRIDAFSGRNSIGLGCSMLTRYLDEITPLFVDTLMGPALDADELRRAQAVALEDIRTLEDDLGRLVGRMFCESLFDGHPYARPILGSLESVAKIAPEQIIAHYRSCVASAPFVVSVSGKFNPSTIIPYFERIKREKVVGRSPSVIPFVRPQAPRVAEIKKNREQSHLIVGFSGTRITDRDRYDLRTLITVLGGQSGRLFTELRDKGGLCYTVAPVSFEGIEPGYIGVYMGCDPVKRDEALAGIRRELDRLISKPVPAAELKRAKEFVLGRHQLEMQLNSSAGGSAAFNTLYGLGYDEHLRMAEGLRPVSAASIQKLAARIFDSPSVTALVI